MLSLRHLLGHTKITWSVNLTENCICYIWFQISTSQHNCFILIISIRQVIDEIKICKGFVK